MTTGGSHWPRLRQFGAPSAVACSPGSRYTLGAGSSQSHMRYVDPVDRCWWFVACVSAIALALPTPTLAQSAATPTTVNAGKLAPDGTPPTIDGKVDEAVWTAITPHTTFTQQDPRLGEPATERTEVRLLFSNTHVYASFICFDEDPSKIIMSQARRDASLAETDSIIAIFDTFNDNQNAFVFGTNPLGIEYDGQVAREGQTSGITFGGGAAGTQRGGISAFNPNWDGDWVVRALGDRARLGSRDGHSAEDPALRHGREPDLGLQRAPQHPPQERAGLPAPRFRAASTSTASRWRPRCRA